MKTLIGSMVMLALLFAGAVHARWEHIELQRRRASEQFMRRVRELVPYLEGLTKAIAAIGVSSTQMATAFRAFSVLIQQSVTDHEHPTMAPIGDVAYGGVDLERCWRCDTRIPRDDDLGLCVSCVAQLQSL